MENWRSLNAFSIISAMITIKRPTIVANASTNRIDFHSENNIADDDKTGEKYVMNWIYDVCVEGIQRFVQVGYLHT